MNEIIEAFDIGADQIRVTFRFTVDATTMDPSQFTAEPTGVPANLITTETETTIILDMNGAINTDTELMWSATDPQFISPATVPLQH